jgi:hypothetical protein
MSDLDRQASGIDSGKPDFLDDDERYPKSCEVCGWDMEWAECHMIDCEDGAYDLGEEDPINYAPGTYDTCRECDGKGGWWYCPNDKCQPTQANPEAQPK